MNQAFSPTFTMPRFAPRAWAAAVVVALGAAAAHMDGPSPDDEATATAASVADAQRTARLQTAIDRECANHPDPLRCALKVVQQKEPHNWKEAEI